MIILIVNRIVKFFGVCALGLSTHIYTHADISTRGKIRNIDGQRDAHEMPLIAPATVIEAPTIAIERHIVKFGAQFTVNGFVSTKCSVQIDSSYHEIRQRTQTLA